MKKSLVIVSLFCFLNLGLSSNLYASSTNLICISKDFEFNVLIPESGSEAIIQNQVVDLKRNSSSYTLEHFSSKEGVDVAISFNISRATGKFQGIWYIDDIKPFYEGYCKLKPKNKF